MIRIGELEVNLQGRAVRVGDAEVPLCARTFDILAALLDAQGGLVTKHALMDRVWPDTFVEENTLQVYVSQLRKALGGSRALIQTVSGRGYRLAGAQGVSTGAVDAGCFDRLPRSGGPLIGRESAIADVVRAFEGTRHLTLVGAGGIGKTRLAIEAARALAGLCPDGVAFVALASATSTADAIDATLGALGIKPSAGPRSVARLRGELAGRRMLVLLDNCEHLLEAAASVAEALAGCGSTIRVLATSREPLKTVSERVYAVQPLHVPTPLDPLEQIRESTAVQLFVARASALNLRIPIDLDSLALMATICRRLDGIPLAIELAGSRAAVLGVKAVAEHLDDRFRILTGGNRTALPRHQTLRATLDWSHALLDDHERAVLRRLAIFRATFPVEAAVAVATDGAIGGDAIRHAISGLVEKSLLHGVEGEAAGRMQFRLLETMRVYAQQKLDEHGERRRTAMAHARYFLGVLDEVLDDDASRLARPTIAPCERATQPARGVVFGDTRGWIDDLRAALSWSLAASGEALALGEDLATRYVNLLFELSKVEECCDWARRFLASIEARESRAGSDVNADVDAPRLARIKLRLQAALAAALVYVHGPDEATRRRWREVLESARALGERPFEARALWGLWNASQSAGAAREAVQYARRFAELAEAMHRQGEAGTTSCLLGERLIAISSHYAGDQVAAHAAISRFMPHAGDLYQSLPLGISIDQHVVGSATLARILWMRGETGEAARVSASCLAGALAQDQAIVTCYVLIEASVPLALLSGDWPAARHAIDLLDAIGSPHGLGVAGSCRRAFDAYLQCETAPDAAAVARLAAGRAELDGRDFGVPRAMLAAGHARALGRIGRYEAALEVLGAAVRRCERDGELWFIGEIERVRGETMLARGGSAASAEDEAAAAICFANATALSTRQGAHLPALRAAASHAALLVRQARLDAARAVIEPALAAYPGSREGHDFLAAAEVLLAATPSNPDTRRASC